MKKPSLDDRINKLLVVSTQYKHMRGRHDQRDHAWNRGMGRGGGGSSGGGAAAVNAAAVLQANKPVTSEEEYRAASVELQIQRDAGKISYHDMRNQLRVLSGKPPLPPRTRKQKVQDKKALAQAEADVRPIAVEQPTATTTDNQMNVTETQPVADTQAKPSKYADKFSGLTDVQDIVNKAVDILRSEDEAPSTTEELVDFLSQLPSFTYINNGNDYTGPQSLPFLMTSIDSVARKIAEQNEANNVPLDVITVGDSQFTTRPIRTWDQLASIADKIKDNFRNTIDMAGNAVLGTNVLAQSGTNYYQLFSNIPRETPPRVIDIQGMKIYTGPLPENIHEKSWLKLFYGDDVSFDTAEFGNSAYSRVDPSLASEPEWVSGVIPEAQLNEFRKKYNIEQSNSKFQQMLDNFTPEEKQTWDMLQNRVAEILKDDDNWSNTFYYLNEEINRLTTELGEDSPIVQKMINTFDQAVIEEYKIPTPPDYLSDEDRAYFQGSITNRLIDDVKQKRQRLDSVDGLLDLLTESIASQVPEKVSAAYFAYMNKLRLEKGLRGPDARQMGTQNVADMVKANSVVPNPNPAATVNIDRQNNQPMTPKESAQNIINIFDNIKTTDGDAASEEEISNNAKENFTRLTTIIQQLSPKEQMELIKNPRAMTVLQEAGLARSTMEALGIFGHPDVRLEIAQKAQGEMRDSIDTNTVEVLLSDYLKQVQSGGNQEKLDEEFARQIMNIHTSNKNNVLRTAAVHQLFSQVGPNAGVPADRIRSFYVPGIVPPAPHPLAVEIMNRVYERQQAAFAEQGITEMALYRGGSLQGGLPQESWSSDYQVAGKFAGREPNKSEFRAALIPVKYMFVNYATFPGYSNYNNEQEHTILGASMYYDGQTDVRTTGNVVNANTSRRNLLNVMPQFQPSDETMQFTVNKTKIQEIIDRLKKLGAKYFPTKKERSLKSIKRTLARLSEHY